MKECCYLGSAERQVLFFEDLVELRVRHVGLQFSDIYAVVVRIVAVLAVASVVQTKCVARSSCALRPFKRTNEWDDRCSRLGR